MARENRANGAFTFFALAGCRARDLFSGWDTVKAGETTDRIVEQKIREAVKKNYVDAEFESRLVHIVRWDILHAVLELYYGEVIPTGFHSFLAYYYIRGRFPCGVNYQRCDESGKPTLFIY